MITLTSAVQRFLWSYHTETWQLFLSGPVDQCDNYAFCGANSECNVNNSPQCECLTGYTPKSPEKWNSLDRTDGCVRKVNLDCNNRDGFLKYTGMKLPDISSSWSDKNMTLQECEIQCLKNCSCIAYSNLDIRNGGSGCMIWFNNIMAMRKENSEGQEIHIRVAASELDNSKNNSNKKKLAGIMGGFWTLILGITIAGYVMYLKRKKLRKSGKDTIINKEDDIEKYEKENIDMPTFD